MKHITKLLTILLTALIIISAPALVLANSITGKVIKVIDGDTIKIASTTDPTDIYKIRFACIDAPESSQEYGQEAKNFLADQIYNKTVTVDVINTDMYGRNVGIVYLGNTDINGMMLLNGYAWHYYQYDHTNMRAEYTEYENSARTKRVGLWRQANHTAPWIWRREHKR